MSHIESPVKEIDDLRLYPIPRKAVIINPRSVFQFEGTVIVVGCDGRIYSNKIQDRATYSFGTNIFHDSFVAALYKAKVISHKAYRQHTKQARAHAEACHRKRLAVSLQKTAIQLGIPLTAEQSEKVEALCLA